MKFSLFIAVLMFLDFFDFVDLWTYESYDPPW